MNLVRTGGRSRTLQPGKCAKFGCSRWANRHPANVALSVSDEIAGDGANDFARIVYCNKHPHRCCSDNSLARMR